MFISLYLKIKYFILSLIKPFIVILPSPYSDIYVDIYYKVPVVITTVFLKISTQVQNKHM
jgi:hypothetical protein